MSSFLIYSFGVSIVDLCSSRHNDLPLQCEDGVPILVTGLIEELLRLLNNPHVDKFWDMDFDKIEQSSEREYYEQLRVKVKSQVKRITFEDDGYANSKWLILLALFEGPAKSMFPEEVTLELRSMSKYFFYL